MQKIELDNDVFPEIVEMLYKTSPVSLLVLAITAAFFSYLQWAQVDTTVIIAWLIAIETLFAIRLINYF
jgi:hypothetical protein